MRQRWIRDYGLFGGKIVPDIFTADGAMTLAMDGGTLTNTGATGPIVIDIIPAIKGRFFAVYQDEDFPIGLMPDGVDTIRGFNDLYGVWHGEGTVFVSPADGEWEILIGHAPNIISTIHNIRNLGAIGDGLHATEDNAALKKAASRCTTRGSIIRIPENDSGAFPGYNATESYLDFLGTINDAVPGCTTELEGRLFTDVTQISPGGHRIIGRGSESNASNPAGSTIRNTGTMPNDTTPVVKLGREVGDVGWAGTTDEPADGTTLEWLTVNGRGGATDASRVGVYSTCIQERSGLWNVIVRNCNTGLWLASGVGIDPANYAIERSDCWMQAGYTGYGMLLYGNAAEISRCTVTAPDYTAPYTIGNVAFSLRGRNQHLHDCHAEFSTFGLEIGGDAALFWIFNISVEHFYAFNPVHTPQADYSTLLTAPSAAGDTTLDVANIACFVNGGPCQVELDNGSYHVTTVNGVPAAGVVTMAAAIPAGMNASTGNQAFGTRTLISPAMQAVVAIRGDMDHLFNVELRKIGCNVYNNSGFASPMLILDERNGVSLPMLPTRIDVDQYKFEGQYRRDSAVAIPLEVSTSYHRGTRSVTLATGTYNDFDLTDCDELLVTTSGGDVTFTSFTGGYKGRKCRILCNGPGNLIFDHAAATGTAANRLVANTGADITVAAGDDITISYNRGATASRWFAKQ